MRSCALFLLILNLLPPTLPLPFGPNYSRFRLRASISHYTMSVSKDNLHVASALIASSVFLQLHSYPRQEVITECICWCLILIGGKYYSRFRRISSGPFNAAELSTIAFGMIISCLSSSVQKTIWSTVRISRPCSVSSSDLMYLGSITRTSIDHP